MNRLCDFQPNKHIFEYPESGIFQESSVLKQFFRFTAAPFNK